MNPLLASTSSPYLRSSVWDTLDFMCFVLLFIFYFLKTYFVFHYVETCVSDVDMDTCELRCPRVQTRVSASPGAVGGPGSSTGTACAGCALN